MPRKAFIFTPLLVLIILVGIGWIHRYWLFDSYRLLSYSPDATIQELAERSGMSDSAERMFFAARPMLLHEEAFDEICQFGELGLVLGCYKSADIFILDVQEERLEAVEPVTAAHEMLHVYYARITDAEERDIETLLDEQLELVENQRILDEIEGYQNDPTSDLYNEIHSIFGTELADLTPELEEHYSQFFDDRSLVLAESAEYEEVFLELEREIAKFDRQLDALGASIDLLEAELQSLDSQIASERQRIDSLLSANRVQEYNAAVPGFNALVNSYNAKVERVKREVAEYNSIVAERNNNVAAKNNLIKSLDSNVDTIQ